MSSQESNYRRYNIQKSRLAKGIQSREKISLGEFDHQKSMIVPQIQPDMY